MRIGAVGGADAAGAVGFQTYRSYIYNTNTVSGRSLSKVRPIGEDLLSSKTDFSGMTEDRQQNFNPLKRGETVHFADVIAMQMQMGRMNADKVMKPAEQEMSEVSAAAEPDRGKIEANLYRVQHAAQMYQMNMIA